MHAVELERQFAEYDGYTAESRAGEAENLCFSFVAGTPIINNLFTAIDAGEKVALIAETYGAMRTIGESTTGFS